MLGGIWPADCGQEGFSQRMQEIGATEGHVLMSSGVHSVYRNMCTAAIVMIIGEITTDLPCLFALSNYKDFISD